MKQIFVINNIFLGLLLLLLSSCGQTFNSNTGDTGLLLLGACSESGSVAGDRYCAAEGIIQNSCTSCHTGYHDQWSKFRNDAEWKASGRVVAGSTAGSTLISRLKNQGGNMPADNPQISNADYQTLLEWVQMMP